jgi:hypothetical protein
VLFEMALGAATSGALFRTGAALIGAGRGSRARSNKRGAAFQRRVRNWHCTACGRYQSIFSPDAINHNMLGELRCCDGRYFVHL